MFNVLAQKEKKLSSALTKAEAGPGHLRLSPLALNPCDKARKVGRGLRHLTLALGGYLVLRRHTVIGAGNKLADIRKTATAFAAFAEPLVNKAGCEQPIWLLRDEGFDDVLDLA